METVASIKPYIYIDDSQFPDLKGMEIEETYDLIVKVKVKNINLSANRVSGELEVQEIECPNMEEKKVESMSNEEFMKYATEKKKKY